MKIIPTGIESLDRALSGGFNRGSTVLIAGNPGAGKTHLMLHVLYNNMKRGLKGAYISFAETKKQFYEGALNQGIDLREMEEKGLFRFYDMLTLPKDEFEDFVDYLVTDLVDWKPDIVVFDSITVFGQVFGEIHLRAFLHSIVGRLVNALNMLVFLIDEIPYGGKGIGFGIEEFVADGVIVLEMEKYGEIIRRYMRIPKMRNRPLERYSYEYVITDKGIEVFAVPELEFVEEEKRRERIRTNIPGFDDLLGGGLYEGSITLLAGPTGSGKTILALNIAANLSKAGKRVLYIAFEETAEGLRDAKEKLGLEGEFKILSLVPEAKTPVEYYVMIKSLVERENADVLIIDSLSAMQAHMNEEEFTKALRYLQLLSKERALTLVLTYTGAGWEKMVRTGFSTLVDNLVFLMYTFPKAIGETLERAIIVLKSRRSKSDPTLRRFTIGEGGIRIE
ncbi:ATPase domain-containing protein [Thermococcus pacificus]|uniref:non-specific serine/threonine protein kinase n=1 Tax=Thermococcus pacificus TaxID=71998 RepID=A0A218P6R7_9EURY|nr:ATPase domain-containing protein [Thermococcus pacificus]ASJ06463.1 ATPase [Thermococcus pacificus]